MENEQPLSIQMWPASKIKPYSRNHKKHSEEQIRLLVNSMTQFGVTQPIAINPAGIIIAGEGRFTAMKRMKLEQVPVIVLDLPPEKEKIYRIADNELSTIGVTSDLKIRMDELKDFQADKAILELVNLRPSDFLFAVNHKTYDPIEPAATTQAQNEENEPTNTTQDATSEDNPFAAAERALLEGKTKTEQRVKKYNFFIEIEGLHTRDELLADLKKLLSKYTATVK